MPRRRKNPPLDVIIQRCECGADLYLVLFQKNNMFGSYCKRCGRRLPFLRPTN